MHLPTGDERVYIAAYGIAAVYVAARPDGRAIIRCSRDLLLSDLAIKRRWSRAAHITFACWVEERDDAVRIVRAVNDDRTSLVSVRHAQRRIEQAAERLGIDLTEHQVVLERAADAVKIINAKIDEFQETGDLKWFNRAYRRWRIEAAKHGITLPYGLALTRLRRRMVHDILFGIDIHDDDPMNIFPRLPPTIEY